MKVNVKMPTLYAKQRAALFGPARIAKIDGSTKSGKTVGAICWQLDQAITHRAGMTHSWTAMTHPQSKTAYRRVRRLLHSVERLRGKWQSNDTEQRITLWNGSNLTYRGSENIDALYSGDAGSAIIDEDSRCKEGTLDAVMSTLTATGGPLRCIGNVKGMGNWAYQLGAKIRQGAIPDASYAKITAIDAVDAGVLKQEVIDTARAMLPERAFRELFMCEPGDDGGNPFGIEHVRRGVLAPGQPLGQPIAFGVDVAKSHDWFVVIGIDANGNVSYFDRWQGLPWDAAVSRAMSAIRDRPVIVDATGVGDPIYEAMAKHSRRVEAFKFTGESKQTLMESLALAIQSNTLRYPAGHITEELEVFEYELRRNGVRYSAPSGMHDDCVCALGLALKCWQNSANRPGAAIVGPHAPMIQFDNQAKSEVLMKRSLEELQVMLTGDEGWETA